MATNLGHGLLKGLLSVETTRWAQVVDLDHGTWGDRADVLRRNEDVLAVRGPLARLNQGLPAGW